MSQPFRRDHDPVSLLEPEYSVLHRHVGAMGHLYVVRDRGTRETLAAKTMRPDRIDADVVRRFQVEARTWLALGDHENIVKGVRYRDIEGIPFLFLEYVDGVDAKTLAARVGSLPLAQALAFARQLLAGLQHVHGAQIRDGVTGLVHRDLKPENVLITRSGRLKIADWGLVKVLGGTTLTATGQMLGTLEYAAPEQLRDAAGVDSRADLYAAGVLLYEWLTGEHAFAHSTQGATIRAVLAGDAPSLDPALFAEPLCRLVTDLLQREPADRPASAAEVLQRLPAIQSVSGERCTRCNLVLASEAPCAFDDPSCARPRPILKADSEPAPGGKDVAIHVVSPQPPGDAVRVSTGRARLLEGESEPVPAFWIDRLPVTNADFERFLEEALYRPAMERDFLKHWRGKRNAPRRLRDHPVVWIDWQDAAAYTAWAGGRLPTAGEWALAVRAGDDRTWPWGAAFDPALCNGREGQVGGTTPVTTYPGGAAPCGALDLVGNVHEWTQSWHEPGAGRTRLACGGSWAVDLGGGRPAQVRNLFPSHRDYQTGFRCAWTAGQGPVEGRARPA